MSLILYVESKRFFLLLYAVLMLFVSLMMSLSTDDSRAGDVLYVNVGAAALAAVYILVGYFRRKSFYDDLKQAVILDQGDVLAAVPKAYGHEQRLYIQLLEELRKRHVAELERLYGERRDHQDFIMSWIHEVKLPITASRMLMKNSTGKTADYVVDKLEDELDKIDNYVEQALYYSRAGSFSNDYFIAEVSLHQVVKESVKKYSKLFITKRISVMIWETPQFVHSDSKWLGFVMDQVVANALKYTHDGGRISFTVEENSKEKQLQIEDTGVGIQPEDIGRVFDKGFTGSIGRNSKSTGMGLYLAKQMTLKLGHRISIQSEAGTYTRVTIHFPKITNYRSM